MKILGWVMFLSASIVAYSQPVLRLKVPVDSVPSPIEAPPTGRVHFIIQFSDPLTVQNLVDLLSRGVTILEYIPDNALLVTLDSNVSLTGLGIGYAGPLSPTQKISPLVKEQGAGVTRGYYLVEVHPDVEQNDARQVILNSQVELLENPDLSRRHLMVHIPDLSREAEALAAIASKDQVAYIFPASADLIAGRPTAQFASASQIISTIGDGWDGPGQNAVSLGYYFTSVTPQLPESDVKRELIRALQTWADPVQITWQPGTSAVANRTVNFLFAAGDHGDGYPFDGPGGVLAHAFYPSPPNPEPVAGDVHFDESESWHIGSDFDVFSVALHELGHALGMGSSDNPDSVMYPYYKLRTKLSDEDIAAIQTLYASRATTPPPSPLTLTINTVPAATSSASISLSGTVTGGTGTISVTWSTSAGGSGNAVLSGTNWVAANIPLIIGSNTITVVAADATGSTSRAVSTIRTSAPPPPVGTDTTGPTLNITFPSTTAYLTTASSLTFVGTATDRSGVASVTWSTNTGAAGTANGTTQWSAVIPLLVGYNQVIVRATDSVGNMSWRTVVVTRR